MIYLIILILFLIIILFLTVKNKIKALKIISISSISAGILTIIVGYIFKYIILNVNKNKGEINLWKLTKQSILMEWNLRLYLESNEVQLFLL